MRKLIVFAACLAILASLVVVGCGEDETTTTMAPATTAGPATTAAPATTTTAAPAEATVIKLSFTTQIPATHIDLRIHFPGFFKMVEDATNGKYKFDIEWFPVNTILAPADIYDGVVNGVVDVGQSSTAYTPRRFPTILTLSQPGIAPPKSAAAMARAAMELYDKYKPKEFADTHLLYFHPTGPGWMHSKTPVESVDDMKGKRIRVSGTGSVAVELLGGDPIAMPMADVYEAAQKGTIDYLVSPAETLEGWKHMELFNYSTFVPYIYSSDIFFVTCNLDTWNSFPDDLKAAFDSVAMDAAIRGGRIWDYASIHGLQVAAEQFGHKQIFLSATEEAKILEMLKPVRDKWVAELNGYGLPGEEIVTSASEIVAECNKIEFEPWTPESE
jgi:TRAP-type C4-dicarboxylate transport system substrate-binding protein